MIKRIELNKNRSSIIRETLNSLGTSAEGLIEIKKRRKTVAIKGIIKYRKNEIPSIKKIFVEALDSLNSLRIIITDIKLTHKIKTSIKGGKAERL